MKKDVTCHEFHCFQQFQSEYRNCALQMVKDCEHHPNVSEPVQDNEQAPDEFNTLFQQNSK